MSLSSYQKSLLCAKIALDKKGFDVVILELRALSSIADYFVIVTGTSDKQAQTVANAIMETMASKEVRPLGVEGYPEGRWILVDYNDVVVHIFLRPVREFYEIEKLWSDAPKTDEAAVLAAAQGMS